jgi:hypothetical protein
MPTHVFQLNPDTGDYILDASEDRLSTFKPKRLA